MDKQRLLGLSDDQVNKLLARISECILESPTSNVRNYMADRYSAYVRAAGGSNGGIGTVFGLGGRDTKVDTSGKQDAYADKMRNTPPFVYSQVETAKAKLTNIFLSSYPIFQVAAPPQLMDIALQYTAIYEKDSLRYNWASNIGKAIFDSLLYNMCLVEVLWTQESEPMVKTPGLIANIAETQPSTNTFFQGNSVTHIDLFNCFFDKNVAFSDLHKAGDYIGYWKSLTKTKFRNLMQQLEISKKHQNELLQETHFYGHYQDSVTATGSLGILGDVQVSALEQATEILRKEQARLHGGYGKTGGGLDPLCYEVTKLYLRAYPDDFGMTEQTLNGVDPGRLQIFEIWCLGDKKILRVDLIHNNHGYFPIVAGRAVDVGDSFVSVSFSQHLEAIQSLGEGLITAEFESMRRNIYGREIYDSNMVDQQDMENPDVTRKIPVKGTGMDKRLGDAVQVLPSPDPGAGTRIPLVYELLLAQSNQITGLNQVAQGQFVKGNKTNDQFMESIASADQRLYNMVRNIHDTFIGPIKEITKLNILKYQPSQNITQQSGQVVQVNPTDIRNNEQAVVFKVSDGVLALDRMMNTPMLMQAVQMVGSIPELAMQYKVPEMIVYVLQLMGIKDLESFKMTPEDQQKKLAQTQALTDAQTPSEDQNAPPPSQPNPDAALEAAPGG